MSDAETKELERIKLFLKRHLDKAMTGKTLTAEAAQAAMIEGLELYNKEYWPNQTQRELINIDLSSLENWRPPNEKSPPPLRGRL